MGSLPLRGNKIKGDSRAIRTLQRLLGHESATKKMVQVRVLSSTSFFALASRQLFPLLPQAVVTLSWQTGLRQVKSFQRRRCRSLLLGLLFTMAMPGWANCAGPGKAPIDLVPQTCQRISPAEDPSILARARSKGLPGDLSTLTRLYTGALVTDSRNQQWVYPTNAKDPCRFFLQGRKIRMMASFICCDTGNWGKCVFHGLFLGDLGGQPLHAFQ